MWRAMTDITAEAQHFQQVANEYAKRAIDTIRDDLDAYEHAQQCVTEGCRRGSETRKSGQHRVLRHNNPEAWHDPEIARATILQDPLSVQVRSGWCSPGSGPGSPEEYEILLATGGPAARIIGERVVQAVDRCADLPRRRANAAGLCPLVFFHDPPLAFQLHIAPALALIC